MFGGIAALYDATRPTYPPTLIDELLADSPDEVLDVGCGTGIVSALLHQRGARVLGAEPDARMAQVARAKGLAVEVSTFEQWDSRGRRFALLTSGQAWHWVAPQAGADKAADVLRPGGRLAVFWNFATLPQDVKARVDEVYGEFEHLGLDRCAALRGDRGEREQATRELFCAHPAFTDLASHSFAWSRFYTSEEWVNQLATHSDHAILAAEDRQALLDAVRRAIDGVGGSFHADYSVLLISARRRQSSGRSPAAPRTVQSPASPERRTGQKGVQRPDGAADGDRAIGRQAHPRAADDVHGPGLATQDPAHDPAVGVTGELEPPPEQVPRGLIVAGHEDPHAPAGDGDGKAAVGDREQAPAPA